MSKPIEDDGIIGNMGSAALVSRDGSIDWLCLPRFVRTGDGAETYAMLGRLDDAIGLFDRLLAVRNDLGLLAEEYDPVGKRLVGNFPQGVSHIGLINTAFNLVDARGPAQQRSQRVAPAAMIGDKALVSALEGTGKSRHSTKRGRARQTGFGRIQSISSRKAEGIAWPRANGVPKRQTNLKPTV